MNSPEPQDAGQVDHLAQLLEAFGDQRWRTRKRAVDVLSSDGSSELSQHLLAILRSEHRNFSRLNAALQVLAVTPMDVVPAIEGLLHAEDADVRGYAALALGLRGDPRPIPALVAALADVDTNVRVQAIEALGRLQAAAAVDELAKIVESGEFATAFAALDALGEIGDRRIAYRLLPLLNDPFWQPAAIEALGKLGNDDAVPALLDLLASSPELACPIAQTICQIHDRYTDLYGKGTAVSDVVRNIASSSASKIVCGAISSAEQGGVPTLINLLLWCPGADVDAFLARRLQSPSVNRLEVEQIAPRGTVVIPALLDLLGASDEEICIAALEALSRMRDERSYAPAIRLLRHLSPGVRQAAVALLNSLGHADLAADLAVLLHDPEPHVREAAVRIAAYLGIPGCLDILFELASTGDVTVRRAALAHLPALDDLRVVPCLVRALKDDDPRVRATAVNALAEADEPNIVAELQLVLHDSDVWVRYHTIRALRRADLGRNSLDHFISLAMHDLAMQVRIAATEALGDYGSPAIPTLLKIADDSESDLAQAAIYSLGRTQSPTVISLLEEKSKSSDKFIALAAIMALGESHQATAIPPLAMAAQSRDRELAEAAITSLGQVQLPEGRDALLDLAAVPINRRLVAGCLVSNYSSDITGLAQRLPLLPLDVRRLAIDVFSRIRSTGAFDALEVSLNDSEPAVRFAALTAIAHLQMSSAPQRIVGEGQI
jgi:HEAT repeat protein